MVKLTNKKKSKSLLNPLPVEDIEIFQSIKDILECLCNDVWGFHLQHHSSINGHAKWVLRRGANTLNDIICVIEKEKDKKQKDQLSLFNKEKIYITMYSKNEYLKRLMIEGARLL